jgi:hypothetical protein
MDRTTLHNTNTTKHDTNEHDTSEHDYLIVPWRAGTPCRLLGPDTTRDTLSRVVSVMRARRARLARRASAGSRTSSVWRFKKRSKTDERRDQEIHHKESIAYTQQIKKSRPKSLMAAPHRAWRRMLSSQVHHLTASDRPTAPDGGACTSPSCVERATCGRARRRGGPLAGGRECRVGESECRGGPSAEGHGHWRRGGGRARRLESWTTGAAQRRLRGLREGEWWKLGFELCIYELDSWDERLVVWQARA